MLIRNWFSYLISYFSNKFLEINLPEIKFKVSRGQALELQIENPSQFSLSPKLQQHLSRKRCICLYTGSCPLKLENCLKLLPTNARKLFKASNCLSHSLWSNGINTRYHEVHCL